MIAAGASAKAAQTVLGHRSAAFSLTVYGHLFETDLDELADRLEISADFSRTKDLTGSLGPARPTTVAVQVGPEGIEPSTEGL